jgi:hypothetical protein
MFTTVAAQPGSATTSGEYAGVGSYPMPRYRQPAPTLTELVMSSHFVFTRVRPAGRVLLSAHRGEDLPETRLIAEWPPGSPEPIKYWPSDLPASTAKPKPASDSTTTKDAPGKAGTTTSRSSPPPTSS